MLFIIFAVVVALLLVVLQFKQYRSFQKQLAEHQQQTGEIPQATAFSALRRVSLLVPVAICAVVALVIVLRPALVNDPQAYLVLLLILGILFSGSSITGNSHRYHQNGRWWAKLDVTRPTVCLRKIAWA